MDKNACDCSKISGIKCTVTDCKFNKPEHICDAGCIQVQPISAENDAVCSTFESKNF